jgi:hypothetical protein
MRSRSLSVRKCLVIAIPIRKVKGKGMTCLGIFALSRFSGYIIDGLSSDVASNRNSIYAVHALN